jgi:DNA-binding NtrC family response regulator
VRELENAVERAVILSESPEISADLLGIDIELSDLEDDDSSAWPATGQAPTPAMSRPKTCRWKTTSSTSSSSIRTT